MPSARTASSARGPPCRGHEREEDPVEPGGWKAALKMAGDSEWRTGSPITAASRVAPDRITAQQAFLLGLLLRLQEVVVVRGEVVAAVLVGQDVVEPVAVRRVERRLERADPARRSASGEAGHVAEVEGRVDLELRSGGRLAPLTPRANSSVASISSRMVRGQAVVDDPGDLGPVLGQLGLPLDHRGDGDHLVGREADLVRAWSRPMLSPTSSNFDTICCTSFCSSTSSPFDTS